MANLFLRTTSTSAAQGVDLVTVPDLSGMNPLAAKIRLALAKLDMGEEHSVADTQHAGQVFRQSPAAGARVRKGTKMEFWYGAEMTVAVPDVKDSSLAAATSLLENSGLKVGRVDDPEHTNHTGPVVNQKPQAGAVVTVGTSIRLSLGSPPSVTAPPADQPPQDSNAAPHDTVVPDVVDHTPSETVSVVIAPPPIRMPRVIDSTEAWATASLQSLGLTATTVQLVQSSRKPGRVIAQAPAAGTVVQRSTPVKLKVSIPIATVPVPPRPRRDTTAVKKPPIIVPYLLGIRPDSAKFLLTRSTLRMLAVDSLVGYGQGGLVLRQAPHAGDSVAARATIRLWVGRSPDIPWLYIAGGVVTLGVLGVLTKAMAPQTTPPQLPVPVLWLEPHVVPGKLPAEPNVESVARHELQLAPHAGAAHQGVEGDEIFTRELP